MKRYAGYLTALKHVSLILLFAAAALVIAHFPFDVDAPLTPRELEAARSYYEAAYRQPASAPSSATEYETRYLRVARAAAEAFHVEDLVRQFVERYGLRDKPILEIGSGRGHLQDLATDYTGLDISPSVAGYYHKKFVLGSATAMPFADDTFDAIWSIWVFEHVPNPEQALREARRVARDQSVLFLMPAWDCPSWAADGYEYRPYSDFGLWGKLVKASIPLRRANAFVALTRLPTRLARDLVARSTPTKLRYRRLKPNYEVYWGPDADAVNAIDRHEMMLWFRSRGDECLNCDGPAGSALTDLGWTPLVIRVHKGEV
ncbi:MAG: class I SAM-dependent methyltransferase [Deltaproteobacteria bacterium]|nr:class I SAM-dependent methyltransferase [Deltaproteobacteria bacterium]